MAVEWFDRLMKKFWYEGSFSAYTEFTRRPMTQKEAESIDKAFKSMDDAFDKMNEAFSHMDDAFRNKK